MRRSSDRTDSNGTCRAAPTERSDAESKTLDLLDRSLAAQSGTPSPVIERKLLDAAESQLTLGFSAEEKRQPRGDAADWLTSEVFDLGEARSLPAEMAIAEAMQAMKRPNLELAAARRIHEELHKVLKAPCRQDAGAPSLGRLS
jgi:hypothetical protein